MISSTRLREPSSKPLARDSRATSGAKDSRAALRVARTALTGTATTTSSRPATASAMSVVALMRSERAIPGR